MENMETVAERLAVNVDELSHFCEPDPFNPGNVVEGYLCRRGDYRYGALSIQRVNGIECNPPQTVWATPKLRYPFGRVGEGEERKYHWPKFVKVEVYEKIDGTNVLQYGYRDDRNRWFVSYKTRMTPFLRSGKYGDFVTLWRDVMAHHSEIEKAHGLRYRTKSYELYGYRNHILVRYDIPIAARHLFDVDQACGEVVPPFDVKPVAVAHDGTDLVALYNEMRQKAQDENRKVNAGATDEHIEGSEGFVFYVLTTDGAWQMFKAKPEMVEAAHWATGAIPPSIIMPTVWNSMEHSDSLDVDTVCTMLLEEFSPAQVEKSRARVKRCIEAAQERMRIKERVMAAYRLSGLDYASDGRSSVMRAISGHIPKQDMRKAFGVLVEAGIAEYTRG